MEIADNVGNVVVAIQKKLPIKKGKAPTLLQLVLLNTVVCGLELCASAGFTYIPPMLLKAGIQEEYMSIIIGMGPFFGLFLVPCIGKWSDQCRSRFGRRRPFIFWLGVGLLVSLVLIPYGEMFAMIFLLGNPYGKTIGIILLTVGVVLLDFTSQAALTPSEALLTDTVRGTDMADRGFMVYSFMVSVGGCIGYLITALDWTQSPLGPYFGGQEQSAFSVLIILFIVAMSATLLVADDPPLDSLPRRKRRNQEPVLSGTVNASLDMGYDSDSEDNTIEQTDKRFLIAIPITATLPGKVPLPGRVIPVEITRKISQKKLNFQGRIYARIRTVAKSIGWKIFARLPKFVRDVLEVPEVLLRLALTDFFCWSGLMCFNLFFTDFVGQAVYKGNPNALDGSPEAKLYDEGVRIASWGLLFHCVTSASFASVMDRFLDRFGQKRIYFLSMLTFTLAMVVMIFSRDIMIVNMMASVTGIAFAAITTIPFTLVTIYQENRDIFFYDIDRTKLRGSGQDISVLDSSYFLAQVLLSLFMGYIVHWTGTVTAYMITACALGMCSCISMGRVIYSKQDLINLHKRRQRQFSSGT